MKLRQKAIGIMAALALVGCSTPKRTYNTAPIKAPSVNTVKEEVGRANVYVSRAEERSKKIDERLDSSYDYSRRIDNKATVILENW